MNYALAKELRDAQFPPGGKGNWTGPADDSVWRGADLVYLPTLSELIEACGEEFGQLELIQSRNLGGRWVAASSNGRVRSVPALTPDAAVARLWLVLHPRV
jgi:hypothetical protein